MVIWKGNVNDKIFTSVFPGYLWLPEAVDRTRYQHQARGDDPIPQYPLYSASLTEYNMDQVWWLVFLVIRWIMSSLRLDTIWMSQGTGPWMLLSWRELTKQPRTSLTSRPLKWQPQGAGPHQGQLGGCHQVCCWEEAVCLCWWGESLFVFLSLLTEVSLPG